jgi:hypothetical protein
MVFNEEQLIMLVKIRVDFRPVEALKELHWPCSTRSLWVTAVTVEESGYSWCPRGTGVTVCR